MICINHEKVTIICTETHSSTPGRKTATHRQATFVLKTSKYTAEEYITLLSVISEHFPHKKNSEVELGRTTIAMVIHPCPSASVTISDEEYKYLKSMYKDYI